jgi:hypothetical protein
MKNRASPLLSLAPAFLAFEAPAWWSNRISLHGKCRMISIELSEEQSSTTITSNAGYREEKSD